MCGTLDPGLEDYIRGMLEDKLREAEKQAAIKRFEHWVEVTPLAEQEAHWTEVRRRDLARARRELLMRATLYPESFVKATFV